MTTKRLCTLSFVALFLFAVFNAGGCGGSSNDSFAPAPDTTTTDNPSMISVFDSPEFDVVEQELEAEVASDDLTVPPIHVVVIISGDDYFIAGESDDVSSAMSGAVGSSSTLPADKMQALSAKLRPYYESGDVIALFWPTAATINDLYEAVGEPPMNVDPSQLLPTSEDVYPEMYAIAKRYKGDVAHRFSYLVPGNTTFLRDMLKEVLHVGSGDVSGDQQPAEREESWEVVDDKYAGLRPEYLFQARRYANFVLWAARIDSKMAEMAKFEASSEFPLRSASLSNEAQSGELFNYGAQMITIDASYDSFRNGSVSYCNFSSAAHYTVYSFYNFSDKNEYYYVQANFSFKPEAYRKYTTEEGKGTSGSVGWYEVASSVGDAAHNLFSHAPHNVNRSRTLSDGTSYSTTGTTGYKIGAEAGAEISNEGAKVSAKVTSEYSSSTSKTTGYSHSATWTANDWEIIDNSDSGNALWRVDFKAPDCGPDGYHPYWDGNVAEATTQRNDLDAEWMWQVTGPSKRLSIKYTVWGYMRRTLVYGSTRRYWHSTGTNTGTAPLAKPPHIIIKQKRLTFRKDVTDPLLVQLICGGNWTAVSDSDWCYVSPTSGEGTNGYERDIFIYADPFTQEGALATRIAHICLKDTETGQIQTLTITQANK